MLRLRWRQQAAVAATAAAAVVTVAAAIATAATTATAAFTTITELTTALTAASQAAATCPSDVLPITDRVQLVPRCRLLHCQRGHKRLRRIDES